MADESSNRWSWGDRKVCVTGGTGFLGSFLVEKLRDRGPQSVVLPTSRQYNLVDPQAVRSLLADSRPNLLIHLAAHVGGIGANAAHPAEFLYDNLMMGAQLLHEAWKAGVEKFVAVGTVCSYPKFTPVPFREEDLWNGYPEETNAPYGLAKKMLLAQSQAYRQQYGFNSIYLIPANLYGPRDNFHLETSHVIPALIRKCLEAGEGGKSEVVVWGDGSPTREFLYVEDAAEAILRAAESYNAGMPVNLGSGQEISILELTHKIAKLTGFAGRIEWDARRPNGQPRRAIETSKARELFGFEAQVPLDEGLRRTVDWYLQNRTAGREATL